MFGIVFDLGVKETEKHHPEGYSQAYTDIATVLNRHGFIRIQASLYINEVEDMARLFHAIDDLRTLPWLAASVRDIRAFRIEQWSDFTPIITGKPLYHVSDM